MPTTPINGLPSPDSSSPNSPPIHFDALNAILDSRLVPRFATTAARNTAITSPADGMVCSVGGFLQIYRAGWRGVGATVFEGPKKTTGLTITANGAISSVIIPDPGYTYRIDVSGALWARSEVGTDWNLQYRLDHPATGTLIPTPAGVTQDSTNTRQVLGARGVSQPLTGGHVLYWAAQRIGAGTGNMIMSGDTNLQSFVAIMVPVQ